MTAGSVRAPRPPAWSPPVDGGTANDDAVTDRLSATSRREKMTALLVRGIGRRRHMLAVARGISPRLHHPRLALPHLARAEPPHCLSLHAARPLAHSSPPPCRRRPSVVSCFEGGGRTADDEVLLDLHVLHPRRLPAPPGDEVAGGSCVHVELPLRRARRRTYRLRRNERDDVARVLSNEGGEPPRAGLARDRGHGRSARASPDAALRPRQRRHDRRGVRAGGGSPADRG